MTHAGNRLRVFSPGNAADTSRGFVSQKSVQLSFRPAKKRRGNETERGTDELPPPRKEISPSRGEEKTSKEMRQERERERKSGSNGEEKDGEEDGGNLLNVATKWNGN